MANKTIRTILALDGEQQFRNKLAQINSNLSVMRANMKALTTEFSTNGRQLGTLKDQYAQLKQQQEQLKQKIVVLTGAVASSETQYKLACEEYEKAVRLHGEESDEAQAAAKNVTRLEQTYNNYRTQLINTESELSQTNNRIKEINDQLSNHKKKAEEGSQALKKFASALKDIGLETFKTSIKAVSTELEIGVKGLAAYATGVTTAAAAIGKFATDAGASFEEGMSSVEAIAGATGDQMDMLTDKARELGSTTKFTATESAEAFNYMAMAGWNADEMIAGIDGVVNLAAASGEELGLVSDIVTDSLTAFGMGADEAGAYADILAQASSNANTNVAMMGETFQYCAPLAGALGYQADDLAVAIGLMANAGIKGSMAGTSLRSIMSNLAAPTNASAAAMEKLGISLTNEDGTMKSFEETVQQLRQGFEGLSEAEKAEAAKDIAGKPGMSGLLALVNSSTEDYNSLADAIDNSAGAAERMAKIKLDNLKGDVTLLKSAAEGLGVTIYSMFSVKLRDVVQKVTLLVNKIHDGINAGKNINAIIRDISSRIKVFLINGIKELSEKLPSFLGGFNTFITSMVDTITALLPEITSNILPTLIASFNKLVLGLISRFPDLLANVIDGAMILFTGLMTGMKLAVNKIVTELPEIINIICDALTSDGASYIFETGLDILMTLIRAITDNLPQLLQTGMEVLLAIINGIIDRLPELITTAVDIVLYLVDAILDNLDELLAAALQIIIVLSEALVDNLDRILPYIPKILIAIVDAIIDNLPLIVKAGAEIILALGNALVESLELVVTFVDDVCDAIATKFKETDWLSVGASIMGGIFGGITNLAEKAGEKLAGAISHIKGVFTGSDGFDIHSPSKWAKNVVGKNIVLGQIEGMEETAENERRNMFSAVSNFSKLVTSSANDLVPATAGDVSVNLYGNISINDYDRDVDSLITDIETRIYERQMGRGR